TLKIDLTGFMFCHKNRINLHKLLKKLLAVLVDNAPNLEELTIKECGERERLNTKEMSVKFSQLRMLKSLKMPSHFTFESFYDLGKVCRNLPNLQIIWASVGCMHHVPDLQYLESRFPSLIVHNIKEFDHRPRFKELEFLLDEICCRNAKRLEIVQNRKSRLFFDGTINEDTITERTIYTGTPGQFRKVTIEMDKRTREDTRAGKKYNRYYEEDWEHLTDCMVTVDEKKESQEDSRFNCVRFVDDTTSFLRAIEFYQASCWQNVQTISVEYLTQFGSGGPLEMNLIAERCPNLERLIIRNGHCTINPGLNLSSLRDLEFGTSFSNQLPLSHILLAAPNLERVRLGVYEDHLPVIPLEATSMIVDGRILRKLQKLQIVFIEIELDPIVIPTQGPSCDLCWFLLVRSQYGVEIIEANPVGQSEASKKSVNFPALRTLAQLSRARGSEQHAGHDAKDRLLTSTEQHLLRLCLPLTTHSCKMMEMDDATLLQMTKTRLSNLRLQESNLQKLALNCIVKNYRFFAKNEIQEQNLECLPKPLRNKVLEELSDHFLISEPCSTPGDMNVRVDIFKRLVNSRTLKIDLTGFMFCHKNRINLHKLLKKLLAVLVDNAPNLEELTIKDCGERERLNTKEMSVKLSQLRMLKSLKMPSHFTFESFFDLGKVCRNLPNLQIIWASVGCMHHVPDLQYLESRFPSLIVHHIKEFDHRPRFKELEFLLDEICCRNAKRLEIVQNRKSRYTWTVP
ncbi:Hypothetical predicted protein, partial [Cloeon dipterum]